MTLICPMLSISRRLGLRCGIELERWIESLVTDASLKSKPTFRFAFFLGFLCFLGFEFLVLLWIGICLFAPLLSCEQAFGKSIEQVLYPQLVTFSESFCAAY